MNAILAAAAASIVLAGPVLAQSIVSPIEWTADDAPGGNSLPLRSNSTPYRYLQVHDDMTGAAGVILGLTFRRSGTTSTTEIPAFGVTVDAYMSTAATTGATIDATYDANHGPDKTQVIQNGTFNFPPTGTGLLPYDFVYVFPFDTPFVFAGTGPLCWEFQITARTGDATPLVLDAANNSGPVNNPSMVVSKYGLGCTATGRPVPFELTGASNNDWPAGTVQLTATARDGPANANAALLIGLDPLIPMFPLPLPGTTGAASGTCYLATDPLAQLLGTLNSSGDFTFRLNAPASPTLHGLDVFSQAFAPDLGANPWNIVSSNGTDHQVIAPIPSATPGGRVYASGLNATGTRDDYYVLVTQFVY